MLRQILACILTFLGIMATFVFWYEVIPLAPKFVAWDRDPHDVLTTFAVWAMLGAFSCLFLSQHIANWAMKVDLLPLDQIDAEVERAEAVLQKAVARLKLKTKPKLGIYERPELNAYIAGWTFYVARMLAFLLGTSLRQTEEEATSSDGVELFVTSVLIVLVTVPGALVFWWFSRSSALRADTAVAKVMGQNAYAALPARLPGSQALRREIFTDAFKLQSRPFPRILSWLSLQPELSLRFKRFSA